MPFVSKILGRKRSISRLRHLTESISLIHLYGLILSLMPFCHMFNSVISLRLFYFLKIITIRKYVKRQTVFFNLLLREGRLNVKLLSSGCSAAWFSVMIFLMKFLPNNFTSNGSTPWQKIQKHSADKKCQ